MGAKDKELLIKDICARLPYNVICQFNDSCRVIDSLPQPIYNGVLSERSIDLFRNHVGFIIKPYLRPMSNMTEKEKEEYCLLQDEVLYSSGRLVTDNINDMSDWLLSKHFDTRGLIPNSLAIEASKDMYKEEL